MPTQEIKQQQYLLQGDENYDFELQDAYMRQHRRNPNYFYPFEQEIEDIRQLAREDGNQPGEYNMDNVFKQTHFEELSDSITQ